VTPPNLYDTTGALTADKISQNKILVSWNLPELASNTRDYTIAMYDENKVAPIAVKRIAGGSLPSSTFERVGNSYKVYFEIYSVNSKSEANPIFRSNLISFPTAPKKPMKIGFGYSTSGAVTVYWTKPINLASPIQSYKIRVSETASGRPWGEWTTVSPDNWQHSLPKQKRGARRYIEIRAITMDGFVSSKTKFKAR
jgi:hypothetical protein